jgi:hypothetical protein
MTIYYLYVKIHNRTKLKYLGQTYRDPFKYKGSGTRWLNHINKHGYDISTKLIAAFDNKDDLAAAGMFWSKKWNIVASNEWANLTEENGTSIAGHKGKRHSDAAKLKISLALKGRPKSDSSKMGNKKGYIPWNKGLSGYKRNSRLNAIAA